jgi:hypothetical protein
MSDELVKMPIDICHTFAGQIFYSKFSILFCIDTNEAQASVKQLVKWHFLKK